MAFYESKRVLILAIILALLVGAPLTALMLFLAIYSPASQLACTPGRSLAPGARR